MIPKSSFEAKSAANHNAYGDPVDEYKIQFFDGDSHLVASSLDDEISAIHLEEFAVVIRHMAD